DEPGHRVVPFVPCADRDLRFEQAAGLGMRSASRQHFRALPASLQSIVAALIAINRSACSSLISASLSRRNNGTNVGIIGANSLPAGARSTAGHVIRAGNRSGP